MKTKLVKTSRELAISAADEKEWVKDNSFILAKVPLKLLSVGCAQNISKSSNQVIVDVNKNKISLSAASYMPKVVVLAGAALVRELRQKNIKTHECWVSLSAAKELQLTAADQAGLGSSQLQQELSSLLSDQNKKTSQGGDCGYSYAYIVEVYPDSKYFIYSKKGILWKQSYNFIGKSQLVSFMGVPVRVKITYTEMAASSNKVVNDDEEVVKNYGAKTSEANLGIKLMSNAVEAIRMYTEAKETGKWIPQVNESFPIPKNLVHAAADALRAKTSYPGVVRDDFIVMDFLRWQDKTMSKEVVTKLVDGIEVQASGFAVVQDEKDPSTWNVPINTPDRAKKAYEYAKGHKIKAAVRERVMDAAMQYNIV